MLPENLAGKKGEDWKLGLVAQNVTTHYYTQNQNNLNPN